MARARSTQDKDVIARIAEQNLVGVAAGLASGLRTADIKSDGASPASTTQMGEAILKELQQLHA